MTRVLEFFESRKGLVFSLACVALLAGAFSFLSLPIAFYPTVARPTISVACSYPGANAQEVMNTVAGPIEDQVNGVEGFDHMTSTCSDTGGYSLTVYFQADYDRDLALMKVQAAVQQALTQLPQEVKNTGVTVGVGQTIDLGYVVCYSDRGELSRDEVVDYVFGVINPELLRVQGVGASSVQDEKLAIRIWLDSERMAALGLSSDDVVAAVKTQNVQASLGTVGSSPTFDADCRILSLVSRGRLCRAEDFGGIIVRTTSDGDVIYLRDIARTELGHQTYGHFGLFGDKPACLVHLYQLPGANTLETVEKIKSRLGRLERRFPGDLKWDMTLDVSRYSESALLGAAGALISAAILAFVFLLSAFRSFRMAAFPLLASLVALAFVGGVMAIAGIFLTVLSLYALTIAVVFMVGLSAFVMEGYASGRKREVCLAAVTSCCLVSAPCLILTCVGGVQGLVLRPFAVVLSATGFAMAFVAVAVMPYLSRSLRTDKSRSPSDSRLPERVQMPRAISFVALTALVLAAFALYRRVPSDLVPNEDFGVVLVDVKTRNGTSRPKVAEVVKKIQDRISAVCDFEKTCTVLGEAVFSPGGENVARMILILKPWSERDANDDIGNVLARLRGAVADLPEAQVSFLTLPTVPGMGTSASVSALVLSTSDTDPMRLSREAHRLQEVLKRSPLADDVTCGYTTDSPHLRLRVDRAKCESLQIPLASLFATLQHALGSVYVNDVNLGTQVNRVTVMSDWAGRATPETMAGLYVRAKTGAMVPVSALVDYEEEVGPSVVYRYNRYLYCTVDMTQKPGTSLGDAMDEIEQTFLRELPRDYDTGWSGIAYEESSNASHFGIILVLAVLACLLVVLVRFESLTGTLRVFSLAPVAVFAGILAHCLTGVPLSLYSRFALLMLVVFSVVFRLFDRENATVGQRLCLPVLALIMVSPLVCVTGAGAAGACSFGVTLIGGLLGMGAERVWKY